MIRDPGRTAPMSRTIICISLLLFLATLALYWQTGSHEFVNYDDPHYVTNNPQVKDGLTRETIRWAFTSTDAANWHPTTWLSHLLDVELYGLQPQGHHLTSVVLHATNALLLFLLFSAATGSLWQSAFIAAAFALHPLRVESVAWIAERKDVLSTFFALLTLLAFIRYVARPRLGGYLLILSFFALGLMAKPMLVTLPFVMLLLDYWPLNRLSAASENTTPCRFLGLSGAKALFAEKLPLFALSVAASICTLYAQHRGETVVSIQALSLFNRIENSLLSYARYLGKTAYPVDLAVFYPLSNISHPIKTVTAVLLLATITIMVLWTRRRLPFLVTGWFWYLVTMLPVIGLVQVGMQSMADRYTYFPTIGIAIMIAWSADSLTKRHTYRRLILVTTAAIILISLTTLTWRQLAYWRTSESLFRHAITITDNNFIALGYLGLTLHDQQRYQEAIKYYSLSLSVNPWQDEMHHNLGLALRDIGRYDDASMELQQALKLRPNLIESRYQLALCYVNMGRLQDAIDQLRQLIQTNPGLAKGHYSLGAVYFRQNKKDDACQQFTEAVRLAPDLLEGRAALANCQK